MQTWSAQHYDRGVSGDSDYGMDLKNNYFVIIWLSHQNVMYETEKHIVLNETSIDLLVSWLCYVILKEKLQIYKKVYIQKWWQSFINILVSWKKLTRKNSINFKVGKYIQPLLFDSHFRSVYCNTLASLVSEGTNLYYKHLIILTSKVLFEITKSR